MGLRFLIETFVRGLMWTGGEGERVSRGAGKVVLMDGDGDAADDWGVGMWGGAVRMLEIGTTLSTSMLGTHHFMGHYFYNLDLLSTA